MRGLFAVLIAFALWFVPPPTRFEGAQSLRSAESCYRMRMCELALFTGESPLQDRLLEWRAGEYVPYGALAPAASAFLLGRLVPRVAQAVEQGDLDEDALADGARRLMLVLAWIAALSIMFAASKLRLPGDPTAQAGPWVFACSLGIALVWTALVLAPSVDGGSVRPAVWSLLLCSAVLGGALLLARPHELGDLIGLAIGVGVLAGLALANDPFAWNTVLAPLCALGLAARERPKNLRRDSLRAAIFFSATTLIVSLVRTPWPAGTSPWPRFELAWAAPSLSSAELAIDALCLAAIAWLLLRARDCTQRRTLSVVLVLGFVLRMIDARFAAAPLAAAGCALVCWTQALASDGERSPVRRALPIAAAAAMLVAIAWNDNAPYTTASIRALRELRQTTPSGGAWNHPLARQEYGILANPEFGGMIAFHARRASCGALLPGATASEAARSTAGALLCKSIEELAARARELGAAYVIVTRRDLERPAAWLALAGQEAATSDGVVAGTGVLPELLARTELAGFELLRRVAAPGDPEGPAELAVWRLVRPAFLHEPAALRAR